MNQMASQKAIAAVQNIEERDYWLKKLTGLPPKSIFSYDYTIKSPAETGKTHDILQFKLPGDLCEQLIKISGNSDQRLHIILAASIILLLAKYNGTTDIIVGSPTFRQQVKANFINTVLILRDQWEYEAAHGTFSFKDLLFLTRETIKEAVRHVNYPLETLLYHLDIPYPQEDFPLFDTAILLGNIHDKEDLQHIHCNMIFSFMRTGHSIGTEVEYNPLRYKRTTIENIFARLQHLMNQVLCNSQQPLSEISIVMEEELKKLLYDFNHTEVESGYKSYRAFQALFEEQAERTPHPVALLAKEAEGKGTWAAGQMHLTYKQLNQKSDQLAHLLMERGIQADTIVGITATHSVEMVVGILGILKAGGAYLPIDPGYPGERIDYMLKDSGAKVLITTSTLAEEVKKLRSLEVKKNLEIIFIDSIEFPVFSSSHLRNFSTSQSANLAYIIYTSGSTGKPKGVMIGHSNVLNTICWRKHEYKLDSRDRVLQLFSFAFDGFVTSFFTPIVSGSQVVLVSEDEIKDPMAISHIILSHHISHFICVPSFYSALLETLQMGKVKDGFPCLKVITAAGEELTSHLVEKSKQLNPLTEIVNEYGPTENSVVTTFARNVPAVSRVPIGKPIANTKIYILDKYGRLVPLEVPGELCISGQGLARGYLNRPGLTAEKFDRDLWNYQDEKREAGNTGDLLRRRMTIETTPNKKFLRGGAGGAVFSKSAPPGRRRQNIYKTGDLARWLVEGNIEFLGRIDQQVKIRGYRIELGEIQNHMINHVSIKDAVVIDWQNRQGDKYLCAYVVLNPVQSPSAAHPSNPELAAELRDYLSRRLPDYMIPNYFTIVDNIPLTHNGKVDRNAFPGPGIETGAGYVAPGNELERGIVYILSEILGIEYSKISVRANFFNLGVNSISILKIAHRLSQEFKMDISISMLLNFPTVEEVVERMKKGAAPGNPRRAVLLNSSKASNNLFLISGDGTVYSFKELAILLEERFKVYGIQARGILDRGKLPATRQELYEDYLKEIKAVQPAGPYFLGGHCFGAHITYEAARVLEERKNQVKKVIFFNEPSVMTDFVMDRLFLYRMQRKYKNLLQILKYLMKCCKMKSLKNKCLNAPLENESQCLNLPEDLEERRKEVQENFRRLLGVSPRHFTRIINSPMLVFKALIPHKLAMPIDSPRWNPTTIARQSRQDVEIIDIPGDHVTMFTAPHVQELAKQILKKI